VSGQAGTYDVPEALVASLDRVRKIMRDLDVSKIYAKPLSPNDNSKNQPYFGCDLTDISFLPSGEPEASLTRSSKNTDPSRSIKYQIPLSLLWVDPIGCLHPAPHAKLIYYPQYPEVRFSGFLRGSSVNASRWMDPYREGRSEGRWLILGVDSEREIIYAYLVTPNSALSRELDQTSYVERTKVFRELDVGGMAQQQDSRGELIQKLRYIHLQGWIPGQRLTGTGELIPYSAPNGGGYTLEAELGVTPNAVAEPDYLGWEVKQFGVKELPRRGAAPTTLMTPEPDGGFYTQYGVNEYVREYGYPDKSGIEDRLNFGGIYKSGSRAEITGLTLELRGYDPVAGRITAVDGSVMLVDDEGNVAASWSFTKLMGHWKKKHAQAVYVPCIRRKDIKGDYQYHYGKDVELGVGTDFIMLLSSLASGTTYYDPGIKLEKASSENARSKRRSQFRIKHVHLDTLYQSFDFVDVAEQSSDG
jgi:hypothetical protein